MVKSSIPTAAAQPAAERDWMHSRYAGWVLAAIAFAESVFAPILIDPFLIGLIIAYRKRWKRYVLIAIIFSIIGGICGYFIGYWFYDTVGRTLIETYGAEETFAEMAAQVDSNGFVFVLIGAFTPVPYKLVAIASGILQINILTFIVASIVGRILRLGLVGAGAYALSPKALPIMQRHHYTVALTVGGLLISYIAFKLFV